MRQRFWQSSAVTTHLYVATVVTSGRELDPAEGDGALEGHLDGRLLHPILSVGPRGAGDGAAAEVPLYCHGQGKGGPEQSQGLGGAPARAGTALRDTGTGCTQQWPLLGCGVAAGAGGQGGQEPLTLGDAVLGRQEALLEETLQHGADRRPVHQLQHEEVGLQWGEPSQRDVAQGGAAQAQSLLPNSGRPPAAPPPGAQGTTSMPTCKAHHVSAPQPLHQLERPLNAPCLQLPTVICAGST